MTPFVIFAIVLTVLYVFYYTAVIAMDVLVHPNVSKATQEVIEVDADDEVTSVVVVDGSDNADDGENGSTDNEEPADGASLEKEKTHRFNVNIVDGLPDIEKDFGVRMVSGDVKYDRMKALGVSCVNVMGSAADDEDEDEEDLEESDMNEIMNTAENVKGGI